MAADRTTASYFRDLVHHHPSHRRNRWFATDWTPPAPTIFWLSTSQPILGNQSFYCWSCHCRNNSLSIITIATRAHHLSDRFLTSDGHHCGRRFSQLLHQWWLYWSRPLVGLMVPPIPGTLSSSPPPPTSLFPAWMQPPQAAIGVVVTANVLTVMDSSTSDLCCRPTCHYYL